jgi:hypothetical protein
VVASPLKDDQNELLGVIILIKEKVPVEVEPKK